MAKTITHCIRCGTCCRKGGPALHLEDKELIRKGHIHHKHLVTIRKGELALSPINNSLKPLPQELVKVGGKGRDWSCCFFDQDKRSCAIYAHRPLECRLLQCWDPAELKAVIGHDTLARPDIIEPGNPLLQIIATHEQECPCSDLKSLVSALSRQVERQETLAELTKLIRKDLAIRSDVVSRYNIPLPTELFLFGRPLFTIISSYGLSVEEYNGTIQINWEASRILPTLSND